MKRTDVIQHLIDKYNLDSYLELGTQVKDENFNKIKCWRKMCVDIDPKAEADFTGSTDAFFKLNLIEYSIVFIDASHIAEDVRRDFENALKLNPKFILLHDVSPETEERTLVPRPTKTGTWNGSVYKFASRITQKKYTVNEDHGVMIVPGDGFTERQYLFNYDEEPSWQYFDAHRKELLNLISWEEFVNL